MGASSLGARSLWNQVAKVTFAPQWYWRQLPWPPCQRRYLGVQSRGVMDWVEPEATRVFCPDLADIFVRCEAA